MTYKKFTGSIEFCEIDNVYFGQILNISDLISYEGINLKALKKGFIEAVEDYLQP